MSSECSEGLNKVESALARSDRRFISNTLKNKPW